MSLFSKFIAKIKGTDDFSVADWAELERELLLSDLGPSLSRELIEEAKKVKSESAELALKQILLSQLSTSDRKMKKSLTGTTTILIVGVNGTGKTTSVAKLAHLLKESGKTVLLGAGDTFRAGAVQQLQTWGKRIGIEVICGKDNSDPASVAFDAVTAAKSKNVDFLIIDTAGRLHNKNDLMAELAKIKRVVEKVLLIDEVLLVIDATTGQNGLAQAKIFTESVAVSGIILTKLDGSARGGVALAIENQLQIPIKWVGTGESEGDFQAFDPQSYIQGLIA